MRLEFFKGTQIVVVKHRVCKTNRRKYAVCQIVQEGDWLSLVDYDKAQLLPQRNKRGEVSVLDVGAVSHRGQKRKLILVEGGAVYKIKKSKTGRNDQTWTKNLNVKVIVLFT